MRKEIIIMGAIVAVVAIAAILGSNYYQKSIQNERVTANSKSGKPKIGQEQLVRPDSATLGPGDARVTLVEFYDPECESCAAFSPIVKKILKDYEGKIRLVARYMPLHPNSLTAANFTEAAAEQGKFWQARELLFQKQPEWGERHGPPSMAPKPDVKALFDKYAQELGLDLEELNSAIRENRFAAKIERDKKDGQTLGVRKTPQFFVNGRELVRFGESELRQLIEDELRR